MDKSKLSQVLIKLKRGLKPACLFFKKENSAAKRSPGGPDILAALQLQQLQLEDADAQIPQRFLIGTPVP